VGLNTVRPAVLDPGSLLPGRGIGMAPAAPALAAPLLADLSPSSCKVWTYTLHVDQWFPSRMATVKNALGDSVTIVLPWQEPSEWMNPDPFDPYPYVTNPVWSHNGAIGGPAYTEGTDPANWRRWTWTLTFNDYEPDPGEPFAAYDAHGFPLNGTGGTTLDPQDLIGRTADVVNWGLETYSSTLGDCDTQVLNVPVDTSDSHDVSHIEDAMRLASFSGLDAQGSTPTRGALNFAKEVIATTAAGGTVTDHQGTVFNLPPDPMLECNRVNAAILVTDGLSNICNPESQCHPGAGVGGNWAEPYLACATPCTRGVWDGGDGCPDGGPSGATCPEDYTDFPGGMAEDLWNLTAAGADLRVRTWVIGISPNVGPCELNYTAYMGRTDANSPNGDAGFDVVHDPFLPQSTGDTTRYDSPPNGEHIPPHGNYAFFATTAESMREAFTAIVTALGAGDYTTSAPSVAADYGSPDVVSFIASATYPQWKGHLYAYDLTKPATDPDYLKWDAGEVLTGGNDGFARQIYTWNPSSGNALVAVSSTNLSAIRTLCGATCSAYTDPEMTALIDFIRGNDGAGHARPWKLGGIINSTPAVVGKPEIWRQNLLADHSGFEQDYADRHKLVWVGSSDGMLHAFDAVDGAEILALVPPDLLDNQARLFDTYKTKPTDYIVGEPKTPADHLYGVANSLRFADVYFPGHGHSYDYKTVLFVSEGPGGTGIHAIDVTHPYPGRTIDGTDYPADPNYPAHGDPIEVLWSLTRTGAAGTTALAGLRETWSVPALAGTSVVHNYWDMMFGQGFDPAISESDVPKAFRIDPTTGSVRSTGSLASTDATALVFNQAFANGVIWAPLSTSYKPDNVATQALQADLNGKLWMLNASGSWVPSQLVDVGADQPIYYSPAAAAYPGTGTPTLDLYAFASGSFYEKSDVINGPTVGTSGHFIPKVYVQVRDIGTASNTCMVQLNIKDLPLPEGQSGTLGRKTQMTAPPMIFTPDRAYSTVQPFALYLVYDPDAGICVGKSYIVRVNFNPNDCSSQVVTYEAGTGAAAGFAIAGERVVLSRSFVGADGRAGVDFVPDLVIPLGNSNSTIDWWLELQ
jgi:hypothetical protein